ncbi:hypothetical protein H0H81_001961 [Sphagnurus paluster]|uniref:DUF2423 domain-containing protein n=1 Tax=Sphagnurus paluster TaxID=117069 RepID=A0A9P7GX41_9AGAR|nr:hypothetical protein H0H81_001961 [Sphagnurus paluster]
MAKSIRSKAKRNFRSKKREEGVYAAAEAARLHRLNAKLVAVASEDKEARESRKEDVEEVDMPGWCWFATLGLMDAADITFESMHALAGGEESELPDRFWRNGLKRQISLS